MADNDVPRAGMLATVRNRRGVVAAGEPFDGEAGRLHLVHLDYTDDHAPAEERLLWELEPRRHLLPPNALPDPAHAGGPMAPEDFDALLRAARWTALSPYLDPSGSGARAPGEPIASPFHGGVRTESYQLVPLLKALRMPRVSLLIADDVGLGKTVEAGLILTELLLRRRIQRVLVLTPASLRRQWQDELWEKFSLRFEVVDRRGTEGLRRRLGMDATPWRSFSRIVASYHYLRQPDVLQQFLAACRTPEGSPHLPWDLLIVDECHNLMPSPFGEDSELCRMLRLVAPRFEHRLFLSATPHNGHTRSFTGLLEMLDPVRFSRTGEMSPAMRGRVEDVVVRRLKRDINAGNAKPPPRRSRAPGSGTSPAACRRRSTASNAASEGLNLHRTARYLLHYDCPWNPSRLEQRNGRIDRYGQARDVTVHHFASATDADLSFLEHVILKADEIREDLGSVNEVFDRAVHRRLVRGEDAASVEADLDRGIATAGRTDLAADATVATATAAAREATVMQAMAREIDLDPGAVRDTLEAALAVPAGRPQLRAEGESGFFRMPHPDLAGWRSVIDEAVRRPAPGGGPGRCPGSRSAPSRSSSGSAD